MCTQTIYEIVCCNCDYLSICDILCDCSKDKWITRKQMAWCIQSVSLLLALPLSHLISLKHHHMDWRQPRFQDACAHFAHIHKWQNLSDAAYKRGGETSKSTLRVGGVTLLWGDRARDAARMWGRHEVQEKPPRKWTQRERERERSGRSKIIVTLSLDSTHYFSIQWAQCWGDMAEIQLQNTFDSGCRDEAVDLLCHTVSA